MHSSRVIAVPGAGSRSGTGSAGAGSGRERRRGRRQPSVPTTRPTCDGDRDPRREQQDPEEQDHPAHALEVELADRQGVRVGPEDAQDLGVRALGEDEEREAGCGDEQAGGDRDSGGPDAQHDDADQQERAQCHERRPEGVDPRGLRRCVREGDPRLAETGHEHGDGTEDELKLGLTLPLAKLGVPGGRLQGESTWRRSAVIDPTTHQSREISGLKPQVWEGHFSQDLPQWKTTWGLDAYGAWRKTYYRFNEIQTDKLKTYVTLFAEWKPQPDTALRVEINNITSRGFHHILTDYAGPRGTNPITTIDDRDIQFGPMVHIRLRKTFG
ncbi:hypothetical protein GALL_411690 [mine drainage metagenome]|uniref:TonB-dependent receptor-like beta-barrel domain-containing protein n=1 Tax=mine drainage metagenome TaxID=410659 RepID=A0A1J5QB52_9ZZZZ